MKTEKKTINKKAEALKSKTAAELDLLLREHTRTLLDMRLARRSGSVEKTHLFRELRREIARIRTLLAKKSA
ncbi:MAG: 50S ribosomal protein L29 [Opitutales bacterium]|nr:50S ribosomal protein L29 [Opitutales bacterium]